MILLNGFYVDADASRRGEILECLRRIVENDRLEEIHLFVEEPTERDRLVAVYPLLAATLVRDAIKSAMDAVEQYADSLVRVMRGEENAAQAITDAEA